MIAIVDYGVGNLFSLKSSFAMIGQEVKVTSDREEILAADRLILPGVGAFGDAAESLRASGLDRAVLDFAASGKPLMGICLGMQLLFEESAEYGVHRGLGLIPGRVVAMRGRIPEELLIPHIGWNALHLANPHPLMKYTKSGDCVYYVHSFYAETPAENVLATSEYGVPVTGAVARGNVTGCQFHPEKSGKVGLDILRAFAEA